MTDDSRRANGPAPRQPGRNRHLVLDALRSAGKPLGAYELLDGLRASGLRSPPQIYRALDQLIEDGSVHKIESLNAYAPCSGHHCGESRRAMFTVCTSCGSASEAHEPMLDEMLSRLAHREGFTIETTTVELAGLCKDCAAR